MKILIVHNHYGKHAVGGEAMVFRAETELLRKNGVEVKTYERTNSEIDDLSFFEKIRSIKNIHWSEKTMHDIGILMDGFKPDIIHVHNYKFVITPSIFKAAKDRGIRTVLTLHNYRMMVPCGNFMTKKGQVCEKCLTGSSKQILIKRCSQGSLQKSYLQYRLYSKTRFKLNQLIDLVDKYIVLSKFAETKLLSTGVPKSQVQIKPNFVHSEIDITPNENKQERAVFIGRLSFEKGIIDLISAWDNIDYPLYIIGDGPLANKARELSTNNPQIFFLGNLPNNEVKFFLSKSAFLIFPSTLYEGMPMTILEAMSLGVPVIATRLGPRQEIVKEDITGFLYENGNQQDLLNKVKLLINTKDLRKSLGKAAKAEFENKYTPEINLKHLIEIYTTILNQ